MNDPSQSTPPAVDTSIDAGDRARPVDPSRRRLVRSGLAGSVVLGSLVSKPVLGAEYICTVSGHASGNASAHLIEGVNCDIGNDVAYWLSSEWPSLYVKGGLPDAEDACSFDPDQGTLFKDVTAGAATLANVFFYRAPTAGNPCQTYFDLTPGAGALGRPASLHQVLARQTGPNNLNFRLGRATVVSLLNAADPSIDYPITAARIIEMFNAVHNGGAYHVEGANINLTLLGVIEYFESLYS